MVKSTSTTYLSNTAGVIANIIVAMLGLALIYIYKSDFEEYYTMVQEDGILEWATFWAFFISGIIYGIRSVSKFRKSGIKGSWFLGGLSIFCLLIAMEEISWGQRLFGYRAPQYFLENNFQQELNIHNVFTPDIWVTGFLVITLGYGILLPLISYLSTPGKIIQKLGFVTPPLYLTPLFLLCLIILKLENVHYSHEILELFLGLGFLFCSVSPFRNQSSHELIGAYSDVIKVMITFGIIVILSFLTTLVTGALINDDPEVRKVAEKEIQALLNDFIAISKGQYGQPASECGHHQRVYTYFEDFGKWEKMGTGYFKSLRSQGLPDQRATYYIDPWNSPYWVWDACLKDGRRVINVYSYGPDRQRQSVIYEIKGDDVGFIYAE